MSDYQPRFLAYCRAQGLPPKEVMGPSAMASYISWIRSAWARWEVETGNRPPRSPEDHHAFDAWLRAV